MKAFFAKKKYLCGRYLSTNTCKHELELYIKTSNNGRISNSCLAIELEVKNVLGVSNHAFFP